MLAVQAANQRHSGKSYDGWDRIGVRILELDLFQASQPILLDATYYIRKESTPMLIKKGSTMNAVHPNPLDYLPSTLETTHLARYKQFIWSRLFRTLDTSKPCACHHIVPRKFCGLSGYCDAPWNLIMLTEREHYIAHLILAHSYGLWSPLLFYAKFSSSRQIEYYKEQIKPRLQLQMHRLHLNPVWEVKRKAALLGRRCTWGAKIAATRALARQLGLDRDNSGPNNSFYGRHHSEESKAAKSRKMKNRVRLHKNGISVSVPSEHLSEYLGQGWAKGMVPRDLKWITNGSTSLKHPAGAVLPAGFIYGRIYTRKPLPLTIDE